MILTFQQTWPISSPVLSLNFSSSLLCCEERNTHVCCKMLCVLEHMFQTWMTPSSPLLNSKVHRIRHQTVYIHLHIQSSVLQWLAKNSTVYTTTSSTLKLGTAVNVLKLAPVSKLLASKRIYLLSFYFRKPNHIKTICP